MNLTIPEEFPEESSCWPDCPFRDIGGCSISGATDRITHLISWIMEAEI